jgi:flagellin
MPLNVISNFAANVAHRYLQTTDTSATTSLAKISAGTRVLAAKDDAAALAVGSRLALDVAGLKQAAVNAGQASSMLQIADGAMAKVNDILARMKSLAVQAGSGQLSSTDRSLLNTEFVQLRTEISRIAADTEFSGTKLVNGSQSINSQPALFTLADGVNSIGVANFDLAGATSNAQYSISFATTNNVFTFTNGTTAYTGAIDSSKLNGSDILTESLVVTLRNAGSAASVTLSLAAGFDASSAHAAVAVTILGSTTTSFTFKVGTGTVAAEDDVTISLGSVTLTTLGITSSTIDTTTNADLASDAISTAVDTLNTSRATVGALQNRLDFASGNISIAIENVEASRSNLMDLDVASEMSTFVSKQILLQAGVSMLAQANQLPQNLLRLFQ